MHTSAENYRPFSLLSFIRIATRTPLPPPLLLVAKGRFGILRAAERILGRMWTNATLRLVRRTGCRGCVYHSVDIEELHAEYAKLLTFIQLGRARQFVGFTDVLSPLLAQLQYRLVGDGSRELIDVERLEAQAAPLALLQALVDTSLQSFRSEGFVFLA